jgi:hypothetical protein
MKDRIFEGIPVSFSSFKGMRKSYEDKLAGDLSANIGLAGVDGCDQQPNESALAAGRMLAAERSRAASLGILCMVLAACGGQCAAQSIRVPYHPQVRPAVSTAPQTTSASQSTASISSLDPSSANSPFVLTVSGTGFVDACKISWNGGLLGNTTFSSSKLTAAITEEQFAEAGTHTSIPVRVTCPAGTSAAVAFNVFPSGVAASTTQTTTGLSPVSAPLDAQRVVLSVTGTGFGDGCLINWNGAAVATFINSDTQLTTTITKAQIKAVGRVAVVPVSVTCGSAPAPAATPVAPTATPPADPTATPQAATTVTPPAAPAATPGAATAGQTPTPLMFSLSPGGCLWFPTRPADCMNWGSGSDARTREMNNLNAFLNTNGQLSFFNQFKSIYNMAAGATNLSVDLATLNFLPGLQWTVTTNAQVGSTSPTAVGSGTVPMLSSTSAAQAAQNMLWGGTVLTSVIYPVYAVGGASLKSPGGWGFLLDLTGKGGVDIQNFKSSSNVNVSTPPTHLSSGLEGYFVTNSINAAPAGSTSLFAGSIFAGFSYGASYTSHGYARDYGFGNAVGNALGQVSAGFLLNNVATITISRGFGPKQSYIDNTTGTPVARYVNNFQTWSIGITYQPSASSNSK